MIRLYVDDDLVYRPTPDGWIRATTADQAREFLLSGQVIEASLDHDLAICGTYCTSDETGAIRCKLGPPLLERCPCSCHDTGYDICLFMAENDIWPPNGVRVHTANSVGREKMCGVINRYSPYSWTVR